MWFTLFDSQSDDEYDGAMGMTDDEDPRILMELTLQEKVKEASPTRKPRKSDIQKPAQTAPEPRKSDFAPTTKTSTGSRLLNPIGNLKGQPAPVEPKPIVKTPSKSSFPTKPAPTRPAPTRPARTSMP
jgi:hypothetical protein